ESGDWIAIPENARFVHRILDLELERTYRIRLRAVNSVGTGDVTFPIDLVTRDLTLPGYARPPQADGLTASGGIGVVLLTWDNPFAHYQNHARTVVYRATADDFSQAEQVGTSSGISHVDEIPDGLLVEGAATFFYWIAWQSNFGVIGNPSDSARADVSEDPAAAIRRISQIVLNDPLTRDLLSPLGALDVGSSVDTTELLIAIEQIEAIRVEKLSGQHVAEQFARDYVNFLGKAVAVVDETANASAEAIQLLDVKVTDEIGRRESLAFSVTQLQADLVSLDGRYSATAGAVQALTVRVASIDGRVESATSAITDLRSEITALDGTVTATATAVEALTTRVTSAEGRIETVSSSITELRSDLTTLDGTVTANASATEALTTRVTATEGRIETTSESVTALESRVTDAEGEVTSVAGAVQSLTTRVTSAEGSVEVVSTSVTALESRIEDAEGNVQTVASAQETLETRVTNAENLEGGTDLSALARWTVKTTVNGRTGGVGLVNDGTSTRFVINADWFSIVTPDHVPGSDEIVPFTVYDNQVYLDSAVIRQASISTLQVVSGFLGDFDATHGFLSMARIDKGNIFDLTIENRIQSDNFSATQGWAIDRDGSAVFAAAAIRGRLTADQVDADVRNFEVLFSSPAGQLTGSGGTSIGLSQPATDFPVLQFLVSGRASGPVWTPWFVNVANLGTSFSRDGVVIDPFGGDNAVFFWRDATGRTLFNQGSLGGYRLMVHAVFGVRRLGAGSSGTAPPPTEATTVSAVAGANRNVASGGRVTIGGTDVITNPSGLTTVRWTRVSGTGGSLSSTTASAPTFIAPSVTSTRLITWRKTVTNNGVTDTDDVVITVTAATAVTAVAGSNRNVASGGSSVIGGADLITNPSGATTIRWAPVGGAQGSSLSSTTAAAPTFTAPAVTSNRAITWRKTVTNNGVTDTDDITITVTAVLPVAAAPRVTITPVDSIPEGQTHTFVAQVSGGTYDTLERTWTVASGGGTITNAGVYTPADISSNTLAVVRVDVTARGTGGNARDGTSATNTAVETFTVTPVTAPPPPPTSSVPTPPIPFAFRGNVSITISGNRQTNTDNPLYAEFQVDDNSAFSSPSTLYENGGTYLRDFDTTTWQIRESRLPSSGTYYVRARWRTAADGGGAAGGWSPTRTVTQ
ncbi:MAG: hypothetical protein OXC29_25230, partial [Rhodococcus sp.]|nr:hypothetical protein [Rhodococcus sp. (in: high G+C Gram-positive bacteria)]